MQSNRYEEIRPLGEGGRGIVKAVRDRVDGERILAMKIAKSAEDGQALAREFHLLSTLAHAHIPQVFHYDSGGIGRAPFFTMELCEGVDLQTWAQGSTRTFEKSIAVATQLVRVLAHVHENGHVHGDLNPANVIVLERGEYPIIKLLDLDVASQTHEVGTVSGALAYLAPERLEGSEPTAESDLFSLGVLLHLVFFGDHPFPAYPAQFAGELNWEVPTSGDARKCEPFLSRLLDVDPKKRPPRTRELLGYLAQVMGEEIPQETSAIVKARAGRAPRIDQEGEGAHLSACLEKVIEQEDSLAVHVVGSAGSGRTRLLTEVSSLAEQKGARVAHVTCQPGERVLHTIDRLLVQIYGLEGDGIPEEIMEMPSALRRAVSSRFTGWAPPAGWKEAGEKDLRSSRAHLLDGLARAILWGGKRRPLVLLVDSVEYAESETLHVVRAMARALAGGTDHCGMLVTAGKSRGRLGAGEEMNLRPFTAEELGEYLQGVFPQRTITKGVSTDLHRWSGGRPKLFVEGVVAFYEGGHLQVGEGEVSLSSTSGDIMAVPNSLEGLLGERVDQLDDVAAKHLFAVSLLQVPATPTLVSAMVEGEVQGSRQALEALAAQGLLNRNEDASGVRYVIAGVFLQDVITGRMSLDSAAIQKMHAGASKALVHDGSAVGTTGRVIHALLSGDAEPTTIELALSAVQEQAERSASAEALRILEHIDIEGLNDAEKRWAFLELKADALQALARFGEAEETVVALLASSTTPVEKGRALQKRGVLEVFRASYTEADAFLQEGLAILSETDEELRAEIQSWRAQGKLLSGEAQEAISIAEETLAAYGGKKKGDKALLKGRLFLVLGQGYTHVGEMDTALARFADARAAFEEAEAIGEMAHVDNGMGFVYHRLARYADAAQVYRAAMDVFEEMGNRTRQGRVLMNMGVILQAQGEYGRAMEQYQQAYTLAEVLGDRGSLFRVASNLGNLQMHMGDLESARRNVSESLALSREEGNRFIEGYNLAMLGEIARMEGSYTESDQAFQDAVGLFQELGCANELTQVTLERAQLAFDRNQYGEAIALGQEALKLAGEVSSDDLRVKSLSLLAEAQRQSPDGDLDQAGQWIEEAYKLAITLDSPEIIWPVRVTAARIARDRGELEEARSQALAGLEVLRGIVRALTPQHQASFRSTHGRREAEEEMRWVEALEGATARSEGPLSEAGSLNQLLEINKRLNTEMEPSRLLEFIMDSAVLLTGAERGFLLLQRPTGEDLKVHVARNIDQENVSKGKLKISTSIAERVMEIGEPVVTIDAMEDERYKEMLSVHSQRLRSILCVPLRRGGTTIGVIYIDNRFRSSAFDPSAIHFMEAFADQAAIAIGNARLFEEMKKARVDLEASQKEVDKLNRQLEEKLIRTSQALQESRTRVQRQQRQLENRHQYKNIVGGSEPIREVFYLIDRVKDNDVPVLISGESGTGKELVARAVHYNGKRRDGEFVAVNCGSIPSTLFESELFGHMRGSFTGANTDKKGLFEVANKGTLFLDEMGEMPLEMQVKLLRVLQMGEVQKIGSGRPVKVDVRIIVATNRDLKEEVREKRFREDLFYRLNVVAIRLPSLRERLDDIPLLVQHFLQINKDTGLSQVEVISPEALGLLARYSWPGNIRELDTVIKNASLFSEGDSLTEKDFQHFEDIVRAAAADGHPLGSPRGEGIAFRVGLSLSELEREAIIRTLESNRGNKKRTAEVLGVDRRTLYNKLAAHGIRIEKKATVVKD